MKRLGLMVCLLALLGAMAAWWYAPVRVLQRRTGQLLHALTFEADTPRANRQTGIYALSALLAPVVEIDTPTLPAASGTYQREELESAFSWLCDQAKQTRFELLKFHTVKINNNQAEVTLALEALIELPNSQPFNGTYDVTFSWRLDHDTWHLTHASCRLATP